MNKLIVAVTAAAAIALVCSSAMADHNEPRDARKNTYALVTAYAPCTAPNAIGGVLGIPLCTPAVRTDPECGFGPRGSGKVSTSEKNNGAVSSNAPGDIAVSARVSGLEASCEGATLNLVFSSRITADESPGGAAGTFIDLIDFPVGSCIVRNGRCKIKTTVNKFLGAEVIQKGDRTGLEVLGCGLVRTDGAGAPARTASCGGLVR